MSSRTARVESPSNPTRDSRFTPCVSVSEVRHPAARAGREPEMLTQGETGLKLGDGKRNLVKKEGSSVEMANPGDPLADAIPRPLAQLRGRGKYQLLPARRSQHEARVSGPREGSNRR